LGSTAGGHHDDRREPSNEQQGQFRNGYHELINIDDENAEEKIN
jgi:hypothetical protein